MMPTSASRGRCDFYVFFAVLLCLWYDGGYRCSAFEPVKSRWDQMESRLESRVASRPDDASSWRMLGRIRLNKGETQGAYLAFARAVELGPFSAAAQYDFGRVLVILELPISAKFHLRRAIELAPESRYAQNAQVQLDEFVESPTEAQFLSAGFEVKRFDGSDLSKAFKDAEHLKREMTRSSSTSSALDFRLETGVLYNSNVALTPLSRELSPQNRASVQLFVAPKLEYSLLDGKIWRAGPTFSGYFNLNEGKFRSFNLQNYRPGMFAERTFCFENSVFVSRMQYDFTHEEFDGSTFGNQHGLTLSGTAFGDRGDISYFYWSSEYTDFANDGVLSSVTSRDGWTNTLGYSHAIYPEKWYLYSLRGGVDLQLADIEGSDFAYRGVDLFGEAEIPLLETLSLIIELGWGYRDYFDFEFTPSRNENIWRAGVRLRKRLGEHFILSGVFNYDRFDSENVLFEAERFVTGLVLTYEY